MGASRYVGRVGGLAAMLGVGAICWLGQPAAQADTGTGTESAGTSASTSQQRSAVRPDNRAANAVSRRNGLAERARTGISPRNQRGTTADVDVEPLTIAAPPAARPASGARAAAARPSSAGLATVAQSLPKIPAGPVANRQVSASALFAPPITVDPISLALVDGILRTTVTATDAKGVPLLFGSGGKADAGGKYNISSLSGELTYLPDYGVLAAGGSENFRIFVSEDTPFDIALVKAVGPGPVEEIVRTAITSLQQQPILGLLLSPLIGRGVYAKVTVNNGLLVPEPLTTPVAYTYKLNSFDGVPISTNFFPAPGLKFGETAPTIFTTGGLPMPGETNPDLKYDSSLAGLFPSPGIGTLRKAGYNVVTWDSRGKADSGGQLELGAPMWEGQDAKYIVDYYTGPASWTQNNIKGEPLIGATGASYGGGMQLVNAAIDHRYKAIVPGIGWYTLTSSLYPSRAFDTLWGALLPIGLTVFGARLNPELVSAAVIGVLFGRITKGAYQLLERTGPGTTVSQITAPALLIQGIPDSTFPLSEAVLDAQQLARVGTPVKMIWFCGGHGVCLNPPNPAKPDPVQDEQLLNAQVAWLDQYIKGVTPADPLPTFQWVDQNGQFYGSKFMPFDRQFKGTPIVQSGRGRILPIISGLGGGGPNFDTLPLSLLATKSAPNSVRLSVSAPSGGTTQIAGAPNLNLTYSGLGTARHLFAQIVDDTTGLVLGNAVTPIPVTLDGRTHTVEIALNDIAITMAPGASVHLEITNAAVPFLQATALGLVDVKSITLTLPTVAAGAATPIT